MRFSSAFSASVLLLLPVAGWSLDCEQSPPPRISSGYWDYLETCGCTNVEPLSRASLDYEKWLSVCAPSLQKAQEARAVAKALADAEASHCDGHHETRAVMAETETEETKAAAPASPAEPPTAASEPAPPVEAKPVTVAVKAQKR